MARVEGTLARQLNFGAEPAGAESAASTGGNRGLRLAVPSAVLRGPDKYTVLEHRRRQAQIKARKAVEAAATLDFEC